MGVYMNKEEILHYLEEIGLNRNESKVYFASLELGLAKVNEISKKAGIIRETTYGINNSLVQKGLMCSVLKSGVRYFESAEPKKLKSILEERLIVINKMMPTLEEVRKSKVDKPKIELYEGKEGLKTVMEDLLTSKKEILTIASNKHLKQLFEFYFPHFVKKRIKLGIKIKVLTDEKVLTTELIDYKFLPPDYKFKTATWIYNNKVAMVSLSQKEPVGVIIENTEIANAQKSQFNLLWLLLKNSE